ncbi:MAG TPA: hypothetical protein DEG17_14770 [Cyanobacteria bacterium UBA11149]|nr:hypothetical protein [Cyanobacteria bacterium UBA11366]HBK62975.1 hypothetical protein [Cyanobacteria bacterium UBA11166]HBR77268.1 hypothetical protein [Cyanobacteria bacterium UBA11159]HBS69380.1 hypothetical protein [Cyanobacteria bacterium UBA11153]HBW90099.1 hypothetical protein [Cyanobacteria bacterium UBA11149]HCA94969.1 hypothetical protein [Cyanobacteria bacterium UBA9226]
MEFSQIKAMAERALADGKLSREERDRIMAAIYEDKKVTVEEAALMRSIQEKIWKGEIEIYD